MGVRRHCDCCSQYLLHHYDDRVVCSGEVVEPEAGPHDWLPVHMLLLHEPLGRYRGSHDLPASFDSG